MVPTIASPCVPGNTSYSLLRLHIPRLLKQNARECQHITSKQMSFVNVTDSENQLEALNMRTHLFIGRYMLILERFGGRNMVLPSEPETSRSNRLR